jgi:hypothetical protein
MAEDKPSGAWGSSFVVLAFTTVSAVYVGWQKPPLVSSRPAESPYGAHEIKAPQDIDARLWQDPFAAVMEDPHDRDPRADDRHSIAQFKAPTDGKTLTLGVTLPGALYPEAAESRRRLRYAVLAALHTKGYAPTDEKHIGYFSVTPLDNKEAQGAAAGVALHGCRRAGDKAPAAGPEPSPTVEVADRAGRRDGDAGKGSPAPLPKIIPFEQFDSSSAQSAAEPNGPSHIVVLWLDEDS